MRLLLTMLLFACCFAVNAQEPVNPQQSGEPAQNPQQTETPKANPQAEKPKAEEKTAEAEAKAKQEAADAAKKQAEAEKATREQEEAKRQEEATQEQKPLEETATAPVEKKRTKKVVKKDESRRVVIRRVTSGERTGNSGNRMMASGYRIQIYTGGNKRESKALAQRIGERCRKAFPQLSVYAHFISPRWTCRVGDFEDYDQALKYMRLLRNANISGECRIVTSNIWVKR